MTKNQEKAHIASMVLAFMLGLGCVVLPVKAVEPPVASAQANIQLG